MFDADGHIVQRHALRHGRIVLWLMMSEHVELHKPATAILGILLNLGSLAMLRNDRNILEVPRSASKETTEEGRVITSL